MFSSTYSICVASNMAAGAKPRAQLQQQHHHPTEPHVVRFVRLISRQATNGMGRIRVKEFLLCDIRSHRALCRIAQSKVARKFTQQRNAMEPVQFPCPVFLSPV